MNVYLKNLYLFQRNEYKFWRLFPFPINLVKANFGLNITFKAYFSVLISQNLNTYLKINLRKSFLDW